MQYTFQPLGESNETHVYEDFHANVSEILFSENNTFTVTASDDYLQRVFNRPEKDGSGLCQNYRSVDKSTK